MTLMIDLVVLGRDDRLARYGCEQLPKWVRSVAFIGNDSDWLHCSLRGRWRDYDWLGGRSSAEESGERDSLMVILAARSLTSFVL